MSGGMTLTVEFEIWARRGMMPNDRDKYLIDGDLCIDAFIKYENLENDIKNVCRKICVDHDGREVPKMLSGYRNRNRKIESHYNKRSRKIVGDFYKFEIDRFGYSFPG